MRLAEDDEVISLSLASDGEEMISVSQQGYGKRSPLKDYPVKGRGGKGVIGHQITNEDRACSPARSSARRSRTCS